MEHTRVRRDARQGDKSMASKSENVKQPRISKPKKATLRLSAEALKSVAGGAPGNVVKGFQNRFMGREKHPPVRTTASQANAWASRPSTGIRNTVAQVNRGTDAF